MKKHVIMTCSDERYGDFLVQHWVKSLKENVNISDIDIAVIDYGLNDSQKEKLTSEGVILFPAVKDGHVVNIRFRDAKKFLEGKAYDQILFIDGGDIIFQSDISQLFFENVSSYRVSIVRMEVLFFDFFIPKCFDKQTQLKLWEVLKNKPVINAGLIFAPKEKFLELCEGVTSLVRDVNSYGPDQIVVNYVIYQSPYVLLDRKYNFQVSHEPEGFFIKNNTFYAKNGQKISVVHNCGHNKYLRPIKNFGYRKGFNQLNSFIYFFRRLLFKLFGIWRRLIV